MPTPRRHLITWHKSNSLTSMAFLFQIHLYLSSRLIILNIRPYHTGPCHSSKSVLCFTLVFKAFYHMNSADLSSFCPTFINKSWAPCKVKHFNILLYTHWYICAPIVSSTKIELLHHAAPQVCHTPQKLPSPALSHLYPQDTCGTTITHFTVHWHHNLYRAICIFSFPSDPREFGVINKDYLVPYNTLAHLF